MTKTIEDPSLHDMAGELRKLAGQIAVLQGELAGKLAEYDAAGGWSGYQSLAAWASWHLGLPPVISWPRSAVTTGPRPGPTTIPSRTPR